MSKKLAATAVSLLIFSVHSSIAQSQDFQRPHRNIELLRAQIEELRSKQPHFNSVVRASAPFQITATFIQKTKVTLPLRCYVDVYPFFQNGPGPTVVEQISTDKLITFSNGSGNCTATFPTNGVGFGLPVIVYVRIVTDLSAYFKMGDPSQPKQNVSEILKEWSATVPFGIPFNFGNLDL